MSVSRIYTDFPTSVDSLSQAFEAGHMPVIQDAIEAIETKLGVGASTPTQFYNFKGTSTGSEWTNAGRHERELTFTETVGAGTWTGTVAIPAGAWIEDVVIQAVAVWDSETSASLDAGLSSTDPNGFFADVDLKATDLTLAQSISFHHTGGVGGALLSGTDTHVNSIYVATAENVIVTVTKVGDTGSAGRTRALVTYVVPESTTAATKA